MTHTHPSERPEAPTDELIAGAARAAVEAALSAEALDDLVPIEAAAVAPYVGDAAAPLLDVLDTVRAWADLGLVHAEDAEAYVSQLTGVLDGVIDDPIDGDFIDASIAVVEGVMADVPSDAVGIFVEVGGDPLGLNNLGDAQLILTSESAGPVPVSPEMIAKMVALLEAWRSGFQMLPPGLSEAHLRLVRAVNAFQKGLTSQRMLRLWLALKQFARLAARHGISVTELLQKLHRLWATLARIPLSTAPAAGTGTAAGAGVAATALVWFLAALATLLVSIAATHWALGRQIPGKGALTYRQYYNELFFKKLYAGQIGCSELSTAIARRYALFRRLLAARPSVTDPADRLDNRLALTATGTALKQMVIRWLNTCGRQAGATTAPYLRLHRDVAKALADLK